MRVFYSWQSDLPNATNRGFIQKALENAARSIRDDNSIQVEPVIDRDTVDVPGAPDIAGTILDKIEKAQVFVCDVSIVKGRTRERPAPNPNVLVELGYALKALGSPRIILVMNTAFGEPELLPFDLRMKRVVKYHIPEEQQDRAGERKMLQGLLENGLRTILADTSAISDQASGSTESQLLSQRLRQVIDLMNEGRQYEQFSVAKLAGIMGLDKVSELEGYVLGHAEPPFAFLERFAKDFGVSQTWLKLGEGDPYDSAERFEISPIDYYERIVGLKPEQIIFVRDNSEDGDAGIILELAEWKYVVLPGTYSISSHVGGTGSHQIFSFYQLILKLLALEEAERKHRCVGRELDSEETMRLFSGKMFPGVLTLPRRRSSSWWYDFTDVNHEFHNAPEYPAEYGVEFVKAQEIVRSFLKTSKGNWRRLFRRRDPDQ
jgi:hypothetical protein